MLLRVLVLLVGVWYSVMAVAAPDISRLQNKVSQLEKQPETEQNQALKDTYEKTIEHLTKAQDYAQQAKQYQKQMDDFPYQSNALRERINNFQAPTYLDPSKWNKQQLESQLALRSAEQSDLKRKQQKISNTLNTIENQLSGFQPKVDVLRQQLSDVQHKLDIQKFSAQSDELSQAKLVKSQVLETALSNQILMLELEQLSASSRNEISNLELTLTNRKLGALQQYIDSLQAVKSEIRKQATEQAIKKGQEIAEQLATNSPVLRNIINTNKSFSDALHSLNQDLEKALATQGNVANQMTEIDKAVSSMREQVEWLKVSSAFGESLRSRLKQLPNPPPLQAVEQNIVSARLAKYKYQQELDSLADPSKYISQLEKNYKEKLNNDERSAVYALVGARKQLLRQLLSLSENYIYEQAKLKVAYSQMTAKIDHIREMAEQYLFWIPNVNAINFSFIKDTLVAVAWLVELENAQQIPLALKNATQDFWLLYLIGFMLLLYCWYFANHFFRPYLKETADQVGKVTRDKYIYTFNTLVLSILLALPLPLIILLFSYLLSNSWQYPIGQALGEAMSVLAWVVLFFMMVKNMCRDNGLFIAHFKIQANRVNRIYGYFQQCFITAFPALGLYLFCLEFETSNLYSTIGRVAFIVLNLSLAWFYWRLYRDKLPITYRHQTGKNPHLLHHIMWPILAVAPVVYAIMAAAGYFFTANSLMNQVQLSVLLGLGFLLVYYLVHRWMFIQKRRLAFDRAKARRAEILAQREKEEENEVSSSESGLDSIEEPVIDLETISAQSLGLLRTVLSLSYMLLLIYLWAQIYSAFSFLEGVTIWNTTSSSNGIDTVDPISLQDVIFSIFSICITVVLVKNLAGALELLVLQHFDLAPGTGFAITTLTKYIIILNGILISCAFLGIDWSKTQWLVAALTVGLGFGLQEIFANFVSGLIILFEKPIRIGDTVTIRELTGTIAKIKTRATTIIDWDRKEIIVPNKAFITEQFVNWSLSDPITRIITRVGVAYSSDTKQVTEQLYEAIKSCTLVLETPAAEVFFVGFGDSTLDFEIRVYVNELGQRMPTLHELHSAINSQFKEQGIVIDYPQLDLHIKK